MNDRKGKISFCRILGVAGVWLAGLGAFVMAGGNPLALFVLSEWVAVLGITWFALLATYGRDFLWFFGDAFLALFSEREPNERYVEIAESGRRYARGATIMAFCAGSIVFLSVIDGPLKESADHIAASMVAILIGAALSEILFPFLATTCRARSEASPKSSRLAIIVSVCLCGLLVSMILFLLGGMFYYEIYRTWTEGYSVDTEQR